MEIEKRIKEMGIKLPKTPEPVAEYIPAKQSGKLIFCSGQGPVKENGKFLYTGKVGGEVSKEEGYEAARLCGLNALAAVKSVTGSLDKIQKIVKLRGFVNSTSDFIDQPQVVNGASELMVEIFGEKGKHARSALGTSVLPDDIPVELEMIVEIK
ncbi:MAG: RidA family protein [Bacillota bacterium]